MSNDDLYKSFCRELGASKCCAGRVLRVDFSKTSDDHEPLRTELVCGVCGEETTALTFSECFALNYDLRTITFPQPTKLIGLSPRAILQHYAWLLKYVEELERDLE